MDSKQQAALQFIIDTLPDPHLNAEEWRYGHSKFEALAQEYFSKLTIGTKPVASPWLIRTIGQCGSGKTTQLLPAIQSGLAANQMQNYVHLAVRLFATAHPQYQELLNQYHQSLIREKTNQFSLLLLFRVLEKLIADRYNILLEMTILCAPFETYLTPLLKQSNYRLNLNLITLPKTLSDSFAKKRQLYSTTEAQRIIPADTSTFFFNALQEGMQTLLNLQSLFNDRDRTIMWSVNQLSPILELQAMDASLIDLMHRQQQEPCPLPYLEPELLAAKQQFYQQFYHTHFRV